MSGASNKTPTSEPLHLEASLPQSGHHQTSGGQSEVFGRYVLHAPVARGGMATVHIARLVGAEGFSRIVAAKRLHPQFTEDEEFVTMFLDEARIASKIHHPNVVPVFDVFLSGTEVILVQEYVHGVPLDKLFKASRERQEPIPVQVVVTIIGGVLAGLHAAHETKDEMGDSLDVVHRDVSPQNVMVSADGTPRLLDFGIAKAKSSAHVTREGFFKGKITYMAPEQLRGDESLNRTADVYAAGIMLWELLVGRRLHQGRGESELFNAVLSGAIPDVTTALEDTRKSIPEQRWAYLRRLGAIVKRATALHVEDRYPTAAAMQDDLVHAVLPASAHEVGAWVKDVGAEYLEGRQRVIASNEESWRTLTAAPASTPSGRFLTPSGVQPANRATQHFESSGPTPSYAIAPDRSKPFLLAVIGVLLVGIGAAVGMILIRRDPAVMPRSAPTPTEAPDEAAPPAATIAAAPLPVSASGNTDPVVVVQKSPQPAPRPQPRWTPPPPRSAPHPAPAAAPAAVASDQGPNCNPPFYFEGSKKVFKPGCI
jgi:serine/threonine-protein kinase